MTLNNQVVKISLQSIEKKSEEINNQPVAPASRRITGVRPGPCVPPDSTKPTPPQDARLLLLFTAYPGVPLSLGHRPVPA